MAANQTSVRFAANGDKEPFLTDAAASANVRKLANCSDGDKFALDLVAPITALVLRN